MKAGWCKHGMECVYDHPVQAAPASSLYPPPAGPVAQQPAPCVVNVEAVSQALDAVLKPTGGKTTWVYNLVCQRMLRHVAVTENGKNAEAPLPLEAFVRHGVPLAIVGTWWAGGWLAGGGVGWGGHGVWGGSWLCVMGCGCWGEKAWLATVVAWRCVCGGSWLAGGGCVACHSGPSGAGWGEGG